MSLAIILCTLIVVSGVIFPIPVLAVSLEQYGAQLGLPETEFTTVIINTVK